MENRRQEASSGGASSTERSAEEELTDARRLTKSEVTLPNRIPALSVRANLDTPARDVLKALDVKEHEALILLFGGVDDIEEVDPRLEQLFLRGIADVAIKTGAIIVDGGTWVGAMGLMGKAYAHMNRHALMLSLAPRTKVNKSVTQRATNRTNLAQSDPNGARLVLLECDEWGCEIGKLFELADVIAERIPVVAILVNGGPSSTEGALLTLIREWPLVVIEGTGGLADKISECKRGNVSSDDRAIKEIIDIGGKKLISLFPSTESPAVFRTRLQKLISRHPPVLTHAWRQQAAYDQNAQRQQKNFNRIQQSILALGVLATLLALTLTQFSGIPEIHPLAYVIIALPIAISILVAAENRFKPGKTWVLSRAAAEEIKQEIYKFRVSAKPYRESLGRDSPETRLAKKVNHISHRLTQAEIGHSVFKPYTGKFPPQFAQDRDVLGMLTTDGYLNARLRESIVWYKNRAKELEREYTVFQWLIYLVGGVGTVIAAVGQHLWVALTASLAVVFTAYLAYRSTEGTLTLYNRTATYLTNVETWWASLTPKQKEITTFVDQKESTTFVDLVVSMTEETLKNERIGWTQHMESALDQLKEQEKEGGN